MRYLFEECALDMDRRELWRGKAPVAIEPQVFDLLAHLVRHRDRVVSKDELLASVWHGRAISESALFNRINAARSAIGDSGARQTLIKTLPRRGLRFVGAVREEECSPAAADPDKPSLGTIDKPSIAVLPLQNAGAKTLVRGGSAIPLEGDAPKRVVILKFDNMAQAEAWLGSPARKELAPMREKATKERGYIVAGSSS